MASGRELLLAVALADEGVSNVTNSGQFVVTVDA